MAATLGRREARIACETLLLRARADLDGERTREAALQLRVGLEALLAEVGRGRPSARRRAPGELASSRRPRRRPISRRFGERRGMTGDAANEALAGELSAEPGR